MAIDEDRLNEIQMEETIPRRKRRRKDSKEEAEFRRLVRRDIRRMKRAGVEVVVPSLQPNPDEPDSPIRLRRKSEPLLTGFRGPVWRCRTPTREADST